MVPPEAVSVVLCPLHMVDEGEGDMEMAGREFTVTACVEMAEHPLASVPVTVYIVLVAGFTTTGLAVVGVAFHQE